MFFTLYSVDTISELRNYDAVPNNVVFFVKGISSIMDEPMHPYSFSTTSMAVDDNYTVVRPTSISASSPGRWLRMTDPALSYSQIVAALGFIPYSNANPSNYINGINASQVITALGFTPVNPDGTAGQYITGNGTKIAFPTIPAAQIQSDWTQGNSSSADFVKNKPTIPNIKTYLGTTDGSGNYSVTYSPSYIAIPDVQPQLQNGTPTQVVRLTVSTTAGFTVQVTNRASTTLLGIEVLLATTTPVSGASVSVLVTSR